MIGERSRHNRPMAAKHSHGLWAVLALGLWLLTSPAYGQRERRLFPTTGKMRVEVRDATGEPLSQAKLKVSVWTNDDSFKANRDYVCDTSGVAEIALPKEVQ